ncbi:MAG: tRNA (N(6)-L-threonylcarbamoyladenosine(37)-C(2))-methylthiotransferase MtaB [bacterium]
MDSLSDTFSPVTGAASFMPNPPTTPADLPDSGENESAENSAAARPRAAIHTLGCRLNLAESDLMRRQLEGAGYAVVPWGETAELCVINTCTVTRQADAKSRQAVRAARRANPSARIAAAGCFAQLHPRALAKEGMADLVLGNGEKLNLLEHLGQPPPPPGDPARIVAPPIPRTPFAIEGFGTEGFDTGNFIIGNFITTGSGTRAHLKVQDGCDFMCSFCIIPAARGRSRPREWNNLLAEARALAAGGVRELVLTGVNVGTYGIREQGRPRGLTDVLDALDAIDGVERLRIGSIEPTTVAPGLLERMADPGHALTPFLHLPLQSGSARVLAAMRRRYSPREYRAFAEEALAAVPDLCLGADVMAGFPGEDDAAFEETLALLNALPFAYFHVFPYSERQGTAAARHPGIRDGGIGDDGILNYKVPAALRKRRAAVLRALSGEKRVAFQQRFIGQILEVLFEQPKSPKVACGYTANYIRVEVAAGEAAQLRNRILPVRLLESGPSRVAGVLAGD